MAKYIQPPGVLGQVYEMNGYSHAVVLPANARLVIASGQPGFSPKENTIVTSSAREQIEACFENCDVALKAAGVADGLLSAHKVHVFMTDVKDEPTVMEVWKAKYPEHRPTWMGLGVAAMVTPGMILEIQVEAHIPLKTPSHAINHVAISCPDLEALVPWYTTTLGFELIGEIRHCKRSVDPTPFETIFVSYPSTLQELKFAILTSGNGVGFECFEFIDPPAKPRDEPFEFTCAGFFHICVTDPNPDALVETIKSRGGRTVGDWMDYSRYGLEGQKAIYTQDPWGNVVEVMSLSLDRVSSAGEAMVKLLKSQGKI